MTHHGRVAAIICHDAVKAGGDPRRAPFSHRPMKGGRCKAMRVLVVEDEAVIRMLIAETLEEAGYDILVASSGVEAHRLMTQPGAVDLVVTDLNMPEADGLAVANWARERNPHVPVVFVSARSDLLAALPTGAPCTCLAKPFSMKQLASAVGDLLGG